MKKLQLQITILLLLIVKCSLSCNENSDNYSTAKSFIIHQTDELEQNISVLRINFQNLITSQINITVEDIVVQDHKRGTVSDKITYTLNENPSWKSYINVINNEILKAPSYLKDNNIYFKFPNNGYATIPIFVINSLEGFLNIRDLYSIQISNCPINFANPTIPIYVSISNKRSDLFNYKKYINYDSKNLYKKISFSNNKLIFSIYCDFALIPDDAGDTDESYIEKGYTFSTQMNIAINFSKPVFSWEYEHHFVDFQPLFNNNLIFPKNKGTKFFVAKENHYNLKENPILRWNLLQNTIIIDDVLTDDGIPLEQFKYGPHIQKAFKRIKQDLLVKFYELGSKIILKSEYPNKFLQPNVTVHYISQDSAHTSGLNGFLINPNTGEILYSALQISFDDSVDQIKKYYEELQKINAIKSAQQAIEDVILNVVAHEFGHILGLTHNLLGQNCTQDGVYYVSVMSYIYPSIIPPEYSTIDFPYGVHDILSLNYLYADLFATEEQNYVNIIRSQILEQLKEFPYAEVPEEIKFVFNPKENVARCWVYSNVPYLKNFRLKNPEYLNSIKEIFLSNYGKPMPIDNSIKLVNN